MLPFYLKLTQYSCYSPINYDLKVKNIYFIYLFVCLLIIESSGSNLNDPQNVGESAHVPVISKFKGLSHLSSQNIFKYSWYDVIWYQFLKCFANSSPSNWHCCLSKGIIVFVQPVWACSFSENSRLKIRLSKQIKYCSMTHFITHLMSATRQEDFIQHLL